MSIIKNKKIILFLTIILFVFIFYAKKAEGVDYSQQCDSIVDSVTKDQCLKKADNADTYQKMIKLKQKQYNGTQNIIGDLNKQEATTQLSLKEMQQKVQDLSQQISGLESDIGEKEKSLDYDKKLLKNLMQSYFESDQEGVLDLVLLNKDFSVILSQTDQIGQSGAKINDMLAEIENTKAELQRNMADLQIKKDEHEKSKSDLEQKNLNLQYIENQKQALLVQTKADIEKYQALLDSVESEINDLESGIASSADYSNIPPAKGGYFDYPVSSINITQGFGKTSYSGHYASGKHNGVDFAINAGNVFAVKSGKVVGTGNNGRYAYGKWIAINHGDGLVTLYGHLSKQLVSKGDSVSGGEKIAISGNTGNSTGPHLHFSVFVASSFEVVESKSVGGLMIPVGAPVNPMKYFK